MFRWPVLPTCVGMVRDWFAAHEDCNRSPHVRGDGPAIFGKVWDRKTFSPRAWGWSEIASLVNEFAQVLPTCVGMVRGAGAA